MARATNGSTILEFKRLDEQLQELFSIPVPQKVMKRGKNYKSHESGLGY